MNDSSRTSPRVVLQEKVKIVGQWSPVAQIADACELPRSALIEAAAKGAVWWQKSTGDEKYRKPVRLRSLDASVSSGDLVLVNYDSEVLQEVASVPVLVTDQGNYSIWKKPAGMFSQGSKWSDHCTITSAVEKQHGKKTFLVHRLDRAASGLIVVAHTKNALVALTDMFARRQIEKIYEATVQGNYEPQLPVVIDTPVDGKVAHTEIIEAQANSRTDETRLVVKIKTGRKHQIRSHLASLEYPVVGDRLFDKDREHTCDLKLIAIALKFKCPFSGEEIDVRLDR